MKNPALFYGAIVVAIICVALAIYYVIPGIYHVATTSDSHFKHMALFLAIAVVCVIAALVTRPKSNLR